MHRLPSVIGQVISGQCGRVGTYDCAEALRCRTDDAIRFQKSCRWVLTYENDPHAARNLGLLPIPYRHCVYYYAKD